MAYFSPRQNLRATSLQLEVRKIAEQSFILSDKLLYLLTTWLGVERELCPKVLSACLSWYGTTTSQTLARATKPQYSQHSTPKVGHCPTGGDWDLASASGSWKQDVEYRRPSLPGKKALQLEAGGKEGCVPGCSIWSGVSIWLSRSHEKGSGLGSNTTNSLFKSNFHRFSCNAVFFLLIVCS